MMRNDARPDEHEASLIHAKKINAKPKSFSRIENMVNSMLVNPIASFGAALTGARQQKLVKSNRKILDTVLV